VNVPDYDGRTPLHIASSNNNYDIVSVLLSVKSIQVNPIDNFEMTPYHDAMINKHTKVAELLKKNNGVYVHRDLGYKLCHAGFLGNLEDLKDLK
jgi:ankyrin repeat protein